MVKKETYTLDESTGEVCNIYENNLNDVINDEQHMYMLCICTRIE